MGNHNNFALVGASGYIVLRYMKATKETANGLVAALASCDGIVNMDSNLLQYESLSTIRNLDAIGLKGNYHPFCKKVIG